MNDSETRELVAELQRAIGKAQVRFDHMTRLLYSTDASNYQVMPIGVTFPRHADDVVAVHEIATRHQVPILPRGGGTSLAGQTVGHAVVMDLSRHMRRIGEYNAETHRVMVEPGVVMDTLNQRLQLTGLMFGPDPATSDRATFGGMIGNNSTGAHSILYGMTADHLHRLEVVFASGERVWLDADTPRLNQIRAAVSELVRAHQDEIQARFPKTWRTVAGYALDKIDPAQVNLNWLLAGSEGTLATIVQAEVGLVPRPAAKQVALVHFDSLRASLEATPRILETAPSAVELIDRFMLNLTRQNPDYAKYLTFVQGDPAAVLAVEFYGETSAEVESRVDKLRDLLVRIGHIGPVIRATTPEEQANVWKVRKAGFGIVSSERGDTKALNFVEDVAVPVDQLADYIDEVSRLIHDQGTTFTIYAHASAGCLHVQPRINLKSVEGYRQYRHIAEGVADLALKYHGTITGEHGEGLVRGEFSERMFGPQLIEAFRQVKRAFDPDNLMNPDKAFNAGKMDDPATLRYSPAYQVMSLKTRFDWSLDGGLSGAAEMCNGSGVCRKEDTGTMCPSYMATLDEAHATRGRANALRMVMAGRLGPKGIGSKALYEVFELCLACKACKAECPSSVDVARMKSEFLAAYYDVNGMPLSTRLFANIHRLNALGSLVPPISNFMLSSALGRVCFRLLGMPTTRPMPLITRRRFSKTSRARPASPRATLIVDTYTEFNHPEIGHAFLKVTDALGVEVRIMRLPGQACCGRPAISKGALDLARRLGNTNVRFLSQNLDAGPFIFLEPSCLSTFTDDYLSLVDKPFQKMAADVAAQCLSAEAWLSAQLEGNALQWQAGPCEILFHGHCHQKSLWGTLDTRQFLERVPGATVAEIDSGCCGVAGSFGYEHHELSMQIANQRLLPAIAAKPGALVAAAGTSCRTQINEAGYHAVHPVQLVADRLT